MKKAIVMALVLGLIAGMMSVPATAGKKKKKKKKNVRVEREAQGTYALPSLVVAGGCGQADAIGCVTFATGGKEQWITKAQVTDEHGQPVYVSIQQDTDGDNQMDNTVGSFCGELEESLKFIKGYEVAFWVMTPPTDIACPTGQGTSGAIDVTFSNLK